jgi:hypothetical protein
VSRLHDCRYINTPWLVHIDHTCILSSLRQGGPHARQHRFHSLNMVPHNVSFVWCHLPEIHDTDTKYSIEPAEGGSNESLVIKVTSSASRLLPAIAEARLDCAMTSCSIGNGIVDGPCCKNTDHFGSTSSCGLHVAMLRPQVNA